MEPQAEIFLSWFLARGGQGRPTPPKESVGRWRHGHAAALECVRDSERSRSALFNAAPAIYFSGALRKRLFEPIININLNFKTKNIFERLSTVKYFHKISLKHGTVLDIP
jgi:hypothetical protein